MFDVPDWSRLFLPQVPLLELFLRATITYLAIFVLLRLTPQRQASGLSIGDIIVVVLIADAASPGLAGDDASSIGDGLILVTVVLFWNFVVNWVGFRIPALDRFAHPLPIPLIEDGKLDRRAMRKQMVTEEELMTKLRQDGLERFDQVKRAHLEGDGSISVVPEEV